MIRFGLVVAGAMLASGVFAQTVNQGHWHEYANPWSERYEKLLKRGHGDLLLKYCDWAEDTHEFNICIDSYPNMTFIFLACDEVFISPEDILACFKFASKTTREKLEKTFGD